jgi:hypothetical protein
MRYLYWTCAAQPGFLLHHTGTRRAACKVEGRVEGKIEVKVKLKA